MERNREERNQIWKAIGSGVVAGIAGTVVMTLAEKLEQRVTGRPSSYLPAQTAERLFGLRSLPDRRRNGRNLAMHFFNGVVGGVLRGLLARAGARGLSGMALFTAMRLAFDELMENATAVGAPPWTWPVDELAIDVLHKAVYAAVTGALADRMVRPIDRSQYPEIWETVARQSPYFGDKVRRAHATPARW